MNIHEKIYERITKLVPALRDYEPGTGLKLVATGYMDLNIDILRVERAGPSGPAVDRIIISLAHNYVQNGDVMADPDMEVAVMPALSMAEALTFQQDSPPLYRKVYPEPGKVAPKAKRELNAFLLSWLENIEQQGHILPDMVMA